MERIIKNLNSGGLGEIIRSAVFSVDKDLNVTSWNKKAEDITGYKREEILGHKCSRFCKCCIEEQCILYNKSIAKPCFDIYCEILRKDGAVLKVKKNVSLITSEKGDVLGGVACFEECDLIDQYLKVIKQMGDQFEALINLPTDAVIMINEDGKIEYWNKAAHLIFGYEDQEALGQDIHKLLAPMDFYDRISQGMKKFREIGSGEVISKVLELTAKRKNDEIFPMEITVSPVKKNDGWGAIGIIRDISERKNQEKKRIELEQKMYQSAKLASIGLLAAGVAHEINNPLAIIQGHIELMGMHLKNYKTFDDKLASHVATQQMAVDRIHSIVSGLNNYARQDHMVDELVDINQAIHETLDLLGVVLSKNDIVVKLDLSTDTVTFIGNMGRMKQVIINLLSNAKDALFKRPNKQILLSTCREQDNIVFRISDTGQGIPADKIDKIFENFYTTKPVGQGTGLGLSISQSIINDFKGKIKVKSIFDQGTTFSIIIPYCDDARGLLHLHDEQKKEEDLEGQKISGSAIVVEDEEYLREMYTNYLHNMGLRVASFENGMMAYSYLEKHSDVDVVLTDLRMPLMDGQALIKKIFQNECLSHIKIIAMTGGVNLDHQLDTIDKNVSGIIHKPFGVGELYQEVIKCLSKDNRSSVIKKAV